MKAFRWIFLLASVLSLAACVSTTVFNVKEAKVPATIHSADEVHAAIDEAGQKIGWQMHDVAPGHIVASYSQRGALAVVDISYTADSYNITHKDSHGFNYDASANTIRRHYNWWIANLNKSIQAELVKPHLVSKSIAKAKADTVTATHTQQTQPEAVVASNKSVK